MKKIILILLAVLVIVVGCSTEQAETAGEEVGEEVTETAAPSEAEAEAPAAARTEVSFQEGDCPLTAEAVREYCNIRAQPFTVDTERCMATTPAVGTETPYLITSFYVDSLSYLYSEYGVSSPRELFEALREESITSGVSDGDIICENYEAPLEDVGDEAIVSLIVFTEPGPAAATRCGVINDIGDLETFEIYVVDGNTYAYVSSGYYEGRPLDEGCTLDETKDLIRVLVLGEEVQPVQPASTNCGDDQACFEEKFAVCQPASVQLTLIEGLTYQYEILSPGTGCRVKSKFVANPNPAFVGPEMICNYDNSEDFGTAIQDMSSCEGELYSLMTGG